MKLERITRGSPNGPLLFFLHGWPDSAELWEKQIEYFSKTYYCVAITLPRFQGKIEPSYDFPELISKIIEEIKATGRTKVTLVGHDWGAYLAYLIERSHPELIDKFITMDVGASLVPKGFSHWVFVLGYQGCLVISYLIGGPIGNWMSGVISKIAKAPRGRNVYARMNYPYYYFWRAVFFSPASDPMLITYRPKRPLLYLYGLKKLHPFHSNNWLTHLGNTPGCKTVALNCDHWLMIRKTEETNRTIEEWLKENS